MARVIKQVVEIESEFLEKMYSKIEGCERALQTLKALPKKEYLTAPEFMERISISRGKFELLIAGGKLVYRHIGRKYYIPEDQVDRFFAGELQG